MPRCRLVRRGVRKSWRRKRTLKRRAHLSTAAALMRHFPGGIIMLRSIMLWAAAAAKVERRRRGDGVRRGAISCARNIAAAWRWRRRENCAAGMDGRRHRRRRGGRAPGRRLAHRIAGGERRRIGGVKCWRSSGAARHLLRALAERRVIAALPYRVSASASVAARGTAWHRGWLARIYRYAHRVAASASAAAALISSISGAAAARRGTRQAHALGSAANGGATQRRRRRGSAAQAGPRRDNRRQMRERASRHRLRGMFIMACGIGVGASCGLLTYRGAPQAPRRHGLASNGGGGARHSARGGRNLGKSGILNAYRHRAW